MTSQRTYRVGTERQLWKKVNYDENTAQIKWYTSWTLTNVSIYDLRHYFDDENSKRKRKQTDFLHNQHNVKKKKQSCVNATVICVEDDDVSIITQKMPFYSSENASKLCAEGALKNLLHMLQMGEQRYWLLLGTCHITFGSNFRYTEIGNTQVSLQSTANR